MEDNTLKTSSRNLLVQCVLTINTRIDEVRGFNNLETTNVLNLRTITTPECLIVGRVGEQSTDQSRVTIRGEQAVTVTLRNIVLGELCTSRHKTLKNLVAISRSLINISTSHKLKCLTSALGATSHVRNVTILTRSINSRLIGKFIDNSTVSTLSKCFTQLLGVFRTNVIMVHCIFNIRNKDIRSQETINRNNSFVVLNSFTLIIKRVTGFKVLSNCTTHHGERCTFQASRFTRDATL